jgi:transcription antitermination factor NusG
MITKPQFDANAGTTIDNSRTVKYPWFALQVRSRHESCVADYLNGQGYEWFLPLYKSRKRWSDRIKEVESPLFPGYLFCRFNQHDRLPILKTPGVIQIVGFNRVPAVVEESEISALQTLMAAGVPNHPCAFLELGDKVRIESGPLRGLEGILMDFKGHHRLVLSVTLLQRSVAVEIDSALVTPVNGAPQPSAEDKAHARNRAVQFVV